LSVSGLPPNAGFAFITNSISGSGSTILTVTASNSIAPGQYTLSINALDGNLTLSTNVALAVTVPAAPVFGTVEFNGNALVIAGSNGSPGASYYVLTTTNLALPITNWTVLATNLFGPSGNFTFTNTAPAVPGQYFLLRSGEN
jgi:hypothetical protein